VYLLFASLYLIGQIKSSAASNFSWRSLLGDRVIKKCVVAKVEKDVIMIAAAQKCGSVNGLFVEVTDR
jgi:hypothetical protein